ncbi:hypothetical protein G6O69_28695 [Pseudenhygromyxa sp. WMMC2535]|uniref:hypothetical protein n=1 Tax=Pseudenhygromyxa sp. WMMC2535 TaxID=2712867 RepID=UPI001595B9F2|nr:hypothetical protein [Pseudenhygromyxa sp. WMMC2535]NVB41845.1 hypothetical protein [Pseudenhygromyxa sp. WMMC2535]
MTSQHQEQARRTGRDPGRSSGRRSGRIWISALGLSASLALLTACPDRVGQGLYVAKWEPGWTQSKEATYRFGLPGPAWEQLVQKDTQVAWHHSTDPAVIQIYSECGDHGDSDLEDFTDHQRIDYATWEILEEPTGELDAEGQPRMRSKQYYTTIAEREALRTTVQANLDGVDVLIEYVVLKKNGCLFDLTYIAMPEIFDAHAPEFQRVIDGFRFPVRRR